MAIKQSNYILVISVPRFVYLSVLAVLNILLVLAFTVMVQHVFIFKLKKIDFILFRM